MDSTHQQLAITHHERWKHRLVFALEDSLLRDVKASFGRNHLARLLLGASPTGLDSADFSASHAEDCSKPHSYFDAAPVQPLPGDDVFRPAGEGDGDGDGIYFCGHCHSPWMNEEETEPANRSTA